MTRRAVGYNIIVITCLKSVVAAPALHFKVYHEFAHTLTDEKHKAKFRFSLMKYFDKNCHIMVTTWAILEVLL